MGDILALEADVRIAVLIPCLNEEATIGKVVQDFGRELPHADIYVFDNRSVDRTAEEATLAGAFVMQENRRGKGYVVQAMFQNIEADIYVLVDGDDTYPAESVHDLIAPVLRGEADMVVGSRLAQGAISEFRYLNWFGNKLYIYIINLIFGTSLTDILSGFRAFNRRLVKGVPLFVKGFDIEAELTIKALQRGYQIAEVPVDLRSRPVGSYSKLHRFRDGWQILRTVFALFRDYKPLTFFGASGLVLTALGLVLGVVVIREYLATGFVHQLPAVILSAVLIIGGMLSIIVGLVLHTLDRRFQELEYYLRVLTRR